jgi:predicted Zn-dependent peptidase
MIIADFEVFEPARGFRVLVHPTKKFKTIGLALYLHQPLDERATQVALLPSVLRRGCQGLPDMRRVVIFLEELYGASMAADVVKIGERHLVAFRFEVVNDRFAPKKIRALEKSMGFLWRMLSKPVLTKGTLHPAWVAQEKENLKRLIDGMINERMSYAYERCIQEMCKGEPYSRYEYGKLEEVDAITPRDLTKLHQKMLVEAPVDLFIVGDVEPRRVAEVAKRTFRFRRRSVRVPPPTIVRDSANGLREHVEKLDVEQGKMVLGCRTGVTWGHPETFAMILYNGILGAFPHSKLFVNVREKEGLAYATHSSVDYTKGLLFVTAGIDPVKYARCVEVIKEQMADLAAGKINDGEWEKTRLTITDRVRSREDSPSGKIGAFLEMSLNGHPMTADEIITGISKVTREDVARVASRVKPDTLFFLTRP